MVAFYDRCFRLLLLDEVPMREWPSIQNLLLAARDHDFRNLGLTVPFPQEDQPNVPLIIANSFYDMLANIQAESRVAATLLNPWCTSNEFGDYLAFRRGLLTYMPTGRRQTINPDRTWKRDGRQEGRPARLARRFIRPEFISQLTDKEFETFANALRAQDISAYGTFQLVAGDDITKFYHERWYKERQGNLNASCMRYDNCQPYLKLYAANPQAIKMLCLIENSSDLLLARALVWTTAQGTLLDRIYGSDISIEAFRDYAATEGWLRREHNTYTYPTKFLTPDGDSTDIRSSISLDTWRFRYYPYMDTFKYLDFSGGILTNSSRRRHDAILEGTGGYATRL